MTTHLGELISTVPAWYQALCVGLMGLCVGSFLNVCIYRIPAGRSLLFPGSTCVCGQPILYRDNIPVLGWLVLRGRARCCHAPISWRYPLVEAASAGLFLLCWWRLPHPQAAAYCGYGTCLLAGSVIDLDHTILPDRFTVGLAAAGLAVSAFLPSIHLCHPPGGVGVFAPHGLLLGLVGLAAGTTITAWLSFLAEMALGREAMGQGDIKLMGAIGAWTGCAGSIAALFLGCSIGSLVIVLLRSVRAQIPKEIPFGPMLAAGSVTWVLLPHTLPWLDALARYTSP